VPCPKTAGRSKRARTIFVWQAFWLITFCILSPALYYYYYYFRLSRVHAYYYYTVKYIGNNDVHIPPETGNRKLAHRRRSRGSTMGWTRCSGGLGRLDAFLTAHAPTVTYNDDHWLSWPQDGIMYHSCSRVWCNIVFHWVRDGNRQIL